jgi:hypothetical protein
LKSKNTKKSKKTWHFGRFHLPTALHISRFNLLVGGICAFFLFIGIAALFAGNTSATTASIPASLEKYEHPAKKSTGGKSTSKSTTTPTASAGSSSSGSSSSYDRKGTETTTYSGYKTTIVATDKPAKALAISPSTITIYVNSNNAEGVKAGVTTTALDISSSDGQPINEPSVTGGANITLSDDGNNASRASWAMTTTAGGASPGGYTVSLSSSSPSGTVYTGTIHVDVDPVPAFSLASPNINAIVRIGTTNTADFTGLDYDAGTSGSATPTISAVNVENGDITCSSGLSYDANDVNCTDPNISKESSSTTIPMAFTFQNQYQLITVAGNLIFTNSPDF